MKEKGLQRIKTEVRKGKEREDGKGGEFDEGRGRLERRGKRIAEEGGKATREVTSAVNNLSFKNQSEALIGAVA